MFRYADNDNHTGSCGVSQRPIYILKQSVTYLVPELIEQKQNGAAGMLCCLIYGSKLFGCSCTNY